MVGALHSEGCTVAAPSRDRANNKDLGTAIPSRQFAQECPVPGQGVESSGLPHLRADNYCLSHRNPFAGKLRRLSPEITARSSHAFSRG
jgi:hypothetical protein